MKKTVNLNNEAKGMTAHQRPNLRQAFIFLVKNTDRIKAPGYSAIGFIFLQIDALKFVLLGKTRSTKEQ
jgi:hypothetical protein